MTDEHPVPDTPSTIGSPVIDHEVIRGIAGLWWLLLLRGVLLIAVGGYALLTPGVTVMAYAFLLGIFVLADGVLAILASVLGWVETRWWALLRGVLGIAAGLFVVAHPAFFGVIAVTSLVILLAIQAILGGGMEIVAAIRERKEIEGEWWLVASGVLSIVFGGILLAQPLLAGALLVRVLGVFAMLAGITVLIAAFRLRSFGKRAADGSLAAEAST